jgi:phosphoesterase RecJ-like protein
VDVAKIAERLGGGGHKYASGCKIKTQDYQSALEMLLSAIKEELYSTPGLERTVKV